MKAKFDASEIFEGLAAIALTALFVLFILMLNGFKSALIVWFVILIIIYIFLLKLQNGVISANKNKIIIYHTFLDCRVFISKINMRDVRGAECTVKALSGMYGMVIRHTLNFTVIKKNGRKLIFSKSIRCPKEFNVRRLETLIDEQPLQKLCDFINEQIQTRA